jgi:phosphoglycerate-specific signal transduction histidine kinase
VDISLANYPNLQVHFNFLLFLLFSFLINFSFFLFVKKLVLGSWENLKDDVLQKALNLTTIPRSLTALHIEGCQITDASVQAIVQISQLKTLSLPFTAITDEAVKLIAVKLPDLTQLILYGTVPSSLPLLLTDSSFFPSL